MPRLRASATSALLVSQLPADLRATIVTHSPSVAVALVAHPSVDVILIGGQLFKHSIVTGVHPVAGLTTGNFEEAGIKRALAGRAAETVVLASSSKLNAASPFVIGELALAQTIVVEEATDAALTKPIEAAGVTVVRA